MAVSGKRVGAPLVVVVLSLVGLGDHAYGIDLSGGVRLYGADVAIGVPIPSVVPDLATTVHVHAGGGWQGAAWYREIDGTAQPGLDAASSAQLQNANGELLAWLEQGVAPGLAAFVGPRLLYEAYFANPNEQANPTLHQSGRADAFESLQLSYVLGVVYDTLTVAETGVLRQGWFASTTLEHAPVGLNQTAGGAAFARGTINASYYLPVVTADPFRVYLANRFIVDLIGGNGVPALAQGRIGGLRPQSGLGGAFRGLPGGRLDAPLKTLLSIDLRGSWLTGLFNDWFIPGALVYLDLGTASALDAPLDAGNAFDHVVLGTGAGLSMRVRLIPFLPFDMLVLGSLVFELSNSSAPLTPTLGVAFGHQF